MVYKKIKKLYIDNFISGIYTIISALDGDFHLINAVRSRYKKGDIAEEYIVLPRGPLIGVGDRLD